MQTYGLIDTLISLFCATHFKNKPNIILMLKIKGIFCGKFT